MKVTSGAISHAQVSGISSDQHHAAAHAPETHVGTGITGVELETLSDGSDADALHAHPTSQSDAEATTHAALSDVHHAQTHIHGLLTVEKATNESVTNSTTLQNDDHLLLAIPANETWIYDLVLRAQSVSNESMRIDFSIPSGAAGGYVVVMNSNSSTFSQIMGTLFLMTDFGTDGYYHIKALVINGSTGGNVQFQWAQRISGATATIVKAGSSMMGQKIA